MEGIPPVVSRPASRIALAFLLLTPVGWAQELKITSGVTDFQVLQRGADGRASFELAGTADRKSNGRYTEARILQDGQPVPGFDWTPMTKVRTGRWTGEFKGLPSGGPYNLEVRVSGFTGVVTVANLLVGDLWVLAGQANMAGEGDLTDVQQPIPQIHSFDMSDQWMVAKEPLHRPAGAVDPVYWPKNEQGQRVHLSGDALQQYVAGRKHGAGLGLPFAAEMFRRTGVPIGLIPCAHGSASIDDWDPALKDKGGESLYGSLIRRVTAAGGKVKGVLWYQGESDTTPQAAPKYPDKFRKFVESLRADLTAPNLPFYYVQIGRFVSTVSPTEWNLVQISQLKAEPLIAHSGMVASVDCTLDDPIHISTAGLKRLGLRLANLATHDLFPNVKEYAQMKRGPRPVAAKLEGAAVRVTFSDVNGSLHSDGRLSGFSVRGPTGQLIPVIYDQLIDAKMPNTVLLMGAGKIPENATLWYGYGTDPYCNLKDSADMAVPVFGAMPIQ